MPGPVELLEPLSRAKLVLPAVLLAAFWLWETWHPFFGQRTGRVRHAAHNLALALVNTAVLAFTFGTLTVLVADWAARNQWGLLHALADVGRTASPSEGAGPIGNPSYGFVEPVRFALAIVLLDAWMYVWHRANHAVPLLWRFHRMHHSDNRMDVTTATRFHFGEHAGGATLRLGLIPLAGFEVWHIVTYELLVVAITQFHHADVSLGRLDRWLRLLFVTPDMHKLHHSRLRPETDSNFSTLFSFWDRLARTFRLRPDPRTIEFGLDEFDDGQWQTFWGMLKTPFVRTGDIDGGGTPEQERREAAPRPGAHAAVPLRGEMVSAGTESLDSTVSSRRDP